MIDSNVNNELLTGKHAKLYNRMKANFLNLWNIFLSVLQTTHVTVSLMYQRIRI